jgi:[ribosomal protein S5]-alanine N-acetyltransferase
MITFITMKLLPIRRTLEENTEFVAHPDCQESIFVCVDFYKTAGFNPPWICYYAKVDDELVGGAAFKGRPKEGKVEIAYGTFEKHRQKGIGSEMCRKLIELSLNTDSSVIITARTMPENEYSVKILQHNGFIYAGNVMDNDDGEVQEWQYDFNHVP